MAETVISKDVTILVVDDEERVRENIRQVLGKRGFTVVCARNGIEALLLGGRHPDIKLLITDVTMPPYMDGVELAKAMRRQRPGLRVLFISGHPADPAVQDEISEGKAFFLSKPLAGESLIKTVFGMLGFPLPRRAAPAARPRRNKRCILMLVPEPNLRMRVAKLLRQEGYLVLEAGNIGEALCISQWHVGSIGLLLADADALAHLPAELPERLVQGRAAMRVLCASACGLHGVPLTERVRLTLEQWGIAALGGS
jgi:CheY-like chemotaxis protein